MVTNFHLRNVQSTIRILQGKLSKLTNPTKPGNFQNYENRFNRTRQVCYTEYSALQSTVRYRVQCATEYSVLQSKVRYSVVGTCLQCHVFEMQDCAHATCDVHQIILNGRR